jgi:CO dehydrogenase/acetyl-CoA synthase delta subunit
MGFEIPKDNYTGTIREVLIGAGDKAVTVGGQNTMPLCGFEGTFPHKPKIAMEVYDEVPEDWAPAAIEPFSDVLSDPAAWAKKNVEEYGAEMICLQLSSTDPNTKDTSPEDAATIAKNVAEAISVPLIVYGSSNAEKDITVLTKVSEVCAGHNLLLGPVLEENYRQIGASAIAYKHCIAAETPIDVNMAKQLNILLENLGVPPEKIMIDPSTGALGYGIEYTYSVMERDRLAALVQNDAKMQMPMICNLAKEAWKSREAKISVEEEPTFGDLTTRGILWESTTAIDLVMAGADILIMRHPKAIELTKKAIDDIYS